ASLWGDAIITTSQTEIINNPLINKSPRNDVFEFAIRDLEYAALYLPETAGQAGRLTRYASYGMISRVYLSYSGLSDGPNSGSRNAELLNLAKMAAAKAIEEGPYTLMPNYADLFKIENNNNSESMFALQWVPNGEYGVINPHPAYFALGSEITGYDAPWGYHTRASHAVIEESERNDKRRKATRMAAGDFDPGVNKANGGSLVDPENTYVNARKRVVGSNKDKP